MEPYVTGTRQAKIVGSPAYITDLQTVSPRVRMAARLYATGACKTKKEASVMAGLHPNYLTILTQRNGGSNEVKRITGELQQMIDDETVSTSVIIAKLGRKAIGRLADLMNSESEHVAFKAAQDLADRAPDTQKTQKIQMDAFTLTGTDAKELASALVEASGRSALFQQVATEGLVEVKDILPQEPSNGQKAAEASEASTEDIGAASEGQAVLKVIK